MMGREAQAWVEEEQLARQEWKQKCGQRMIECRKDRHSQDRSSGVHLQPHLAHHGQLCGGFERVGASFPICWNLIACDSL